MTEDNILDLARNAYTAYGRVTGFKNYRGDPMPDFEDLGPTIQRAWQAAVRDVLESVATESE
jgi:hypothetical protein